MDTQGQILKNSTFGNLIEETIKTNLPNTIVEIGTWKGLGSTKRIIDSIQNTNYKKQPKFISIESNYEFYTIAVKNLKEWSSFVDLKYGRIVNHEEIIEYVNSIIIDDIQKTWLNQDLINYSKCQNILQELPEKIDFLLLDGGEFTSYLEWMILKDRSKIIALDDTMVLKNKQVLKESLIDDSFDLLFNSEERNGFCFFLNKKL